MTLAFSENLFAAAVFGFPLYAAGFSTLTVYNVVFLLGMFLSAMAAWALAREVTGDGAASLLAGLVYAFLPWRIDQIPHVQFQWGPFLPLLLLFLLRYLGAGRLADVVLFALCFAGNALANVHYAIFSGVLVAVVLVFELLSGTAGARGRVLRALLATGVAGAAVAPFFLPYVEARRLYGMARSYEEMEFYSGRLTTFLSSGVRNRLYGRLTERFSRPEGAFFPGIVPTVLAVLAAVRLSSGRTRTAAAETDRASGMSARRGVWCRVLDASLAAMLLLCGAAAARPGLRLGPIRVGDPGRLIVFATAVVLLRLALAFPRRSRYRDLADFARSFSRDRRVVLLLLIAAVGVLMALGANTPYYRFLFKTLGFVFRAIRAPARAIVLFHIPLAVLSAWGLSRLSGGRRRPIRLAVLASGLIVTGIEYRAWPITVLPVRPEPRAVDRWLAGASVPGGVMEWPLGNIFDFEYEFRSTAHWKPIVNGSSGFSPPAYNELENLVARAPIPDAVWDRAAAMGVGLLIFHPHDAPKPVLLSCARAVRAGVAQGRLEILKTFPHGVDRDYAFRITSSPVFDGGSTPGERREAAEAFRNLSISPGRDQQPPLVHLDFPPADFQVRAGEWAYGWSLDDSGVLEIRISTELGPAGLAAYGGPRPDVGKVYPRYPDAGQGGFSFRIPDLPPGPHTLIVTVLARDEGRTVLRRPVIVR
ncbi:MAG: hypothetical protein ACM3SU_10455 [Acidobacteriota bacterium]